MNDGKSNCVSCGKVAKNLESKHHAKLYYTKNIWSTTEVTKIKTTFNFLGSKLIYVCDECVSKERSRCFNMHVAFLVVGFVLSRPFFWFKNTNSDIFFYIISGLGIIGLVFFAMGAVSFIDFRRDKVMAMREEIAQNWAYTIYPIKKWTIMVRGTFSENYDPMPGEKAPPSPSS